MDFYVYNRPTIEAIEPHIVPHIIVSITTPTDKVANIKTNEHTLGLLRLSFYDIDRIVPVDPDLVEEVRAISGITKFVDDNLFEAHHARAILDLVESNPTAEHFIVHCDAGMSRSPAVAAALSNILQGNDEVYFHRYHPNRRVYRAILEAYHAKDAPED